MTAIINDEASRVRTQVQSQPGRALSFDGVNDYVDCGNIAAFDFTSAFTVSVWVNPDAVSAYQSLVSKYENPGKGFDLLLNVGDGALRFSVFGSSSIDALSTYTPTIGKWMHIVAVGTGTYVKIYANGYLVKTQSGTWTPTAAAQSLRFGSRYDGLYLDGKLRDVRIYNRELTATEICNLYNATKQSGGDVSGTLYAANLIGWWPLEEINISSIRDASGNDYHGTQSGTVTLYTGADVPCSIKNELGYTLNAGEEYYALASDLTKDIQDDPLGYPGPLAKRALPKASPCATFDGINDYALPIAIPEAKITGSSTLTFSAWVYRTGTSWRTIAANSGVSRNWSFVSDHSTGALSYRTATLNIDAGVIPLNTWQHVAFSMNGTSVRLYQDGVLTGSGTIAATNTSIESFSIASENGSLFWQGRISDIRVFDRVLSDSEVASVYAGNNITSGLVAHWPCSEKSLKLLNDISGNGNNALATGMTSGELWANTQDVYHAGLTAGVRTTNGRRGYRFFNGSNQYFTAQDASSPAVGGDIPFFISSCVRTATIGAGAGVIASKFDGGSNAKSFMLYRSGADLYFGISSNGTTVTEVSIASALTAGSIARILAYHDPVANTIGLSVNGGAFTTAAYSSGIYNASSSVKVGAAETASYPWSGDIFYVGIAKPASVPTWSTVRDAMTAELTYADLTPTQISDWGVAAWYDCDEWGPQLRDKHSDNHLTGANYSTDYPVPAVPALLAAPTHEYGTFSKELAGAFNGGHDAKYACTTGQKLWVAAMVRINLFSTAGDGIVSKYNAGTEWDLYAFNIAGDYRFYWIVYDSANVGQNVSLTGMAVGEWIFLFAYIDATSGLSIGLSSDGGAFVISSTASGPRAGTDNFQIGTFFSTAYLHGDIEYVAIGKAPLVSFSDVRDMLYGGGVPLRFGDLTAAQKTTIGLGEWFDVGEYDGSLTLTGKHAASALTGFCIPSQITHGGPKKLPAIDTAIDFTGGVAAPWTDKQYLGYLTCSGAANGRVVTAATAGKFASGNVSVYVRLRNFTTGSARLFFDNYNASPLARGAFGYNATGGYLSLYDTAYHDLGASVDSVLNDGNWHDILYVWQGTSLLLYIDNVLWGAATSASNSATVSAQWSISTVLSTTDNLQKVVGDIARLIVADGVRVPGNITTAPNLLDLRFDSPNCEDEQCRIPSSAWLTGHTPAKLTVPTAYKHGVILPDGMVKTADELSERQFKLYKQDQ